MTILITGGAGFIGTNLARRLLEEGHTVRIFDSLAHPGARENLHWLDAWVKRTGHAPEDLDIIVGDVRDPALVQAALRDSEHVFHLAAQPGIAKSIEDPQMDFRINAQGTLNVLEAVRQMPSPPSLIFASTNRVYGDLQEVRLRVRGRRYSPVEGRVSANGLDESRPLQFSSPSGCSKGAAEQYVLDYARTFGLRTTVLRMGCIYGPHQHGSEDQGWVAHFLRSALQARPLTIYGDGQQVRDVLYVDDLVDALLLAWRDIDTLAGKAFNIGGGPQNTSSLLELVQRIEELLKARVQLQFASARPGDQKYYVSDTSRFRKATGWSAKTGLDEGLKALRDWMVPQAQAVPMERYESDATVRSHHGRATGGIN